MGADVRYSVRLDRVCLPGGDASPCCRIAPQEPAVHFIPWRGHPCACTSASCSRPTGASPPGGGGIPRDRPRGELGPRSTALCVVAEAVYSAYSGDEYVDETGGRSMASESAARSAGRSSGAGRRARRRPSRGKAPRRPRRGRRGVPRGGRRRPAGAGPRRRSEAYRALLGGITDRVLRLTSRPATVAETG